MHVTIASHIMQEVLSVLDNGNGAYTYEWAAAESCAVYIVSFKCDNALI